jgi:hypothetical protein
MNAAPIDNLVGGWPAGSRERALGSPIRDRPAAAAAAAR